MNLKQQASESARTARMRSAKYLEKFPRARRAVKEIVILGRIGRQKTREMLRPKVNVPWPLQHQFEITIDQKFTNPQDLRDALSSAGTVYAEGRNTIYVPPQSGLSDVLGELVRNYPDGTGFKILKTFTRPEQASYLHTSDTRAVKLASGNIVNQAKSAAALASLEIGPRLIDIVHIKAANSDLTALAVEHVDGHQPTSSEYEEFMGLAKRYLDDGYYTLTVPSGFDCSDFAPNNCNGNLLVNQDGQVCYVDSQVFRADLVRCIDRVVSEGTEYLHFGGTPTTVSGGRRHLYQSIPGYSAPAKRDNQLRWTKFKKLMSQHDVSVEGRLVMDVACNSGMMLAQAMGAGAKWGVGWDLPQVVPYTRRLLDLIGAGRTTLIGTDLRRHEDFTVDLPPMVQDSEAGILMFLAAWQHVDLPKGIADLPWQWLLYEGHGNDSPQQTRLVLERINETWGAVTLGLDYVDDGTSGQRAIALLCRATE